MKKNYLLVVMLAFGLSSLQAGIIYVKPSGNGSGDNWSSAASLADALDWAGAGDQIFVAKGTYTGSFKCRNLVKVYGNCDGTETTTPPEIKSAENLETFLIGPGNARVLYIDGKASEWIGFDISGGDATTETTGAGRGGGVYINNGGATLKYCRIHDNIAVDGTKGAFNPSNGNATIGIGGGIYALQGNLENCIIENNIGAKDPFVKKNNNGNDTWSTGIGGGICLDATEGNTCAPEKAVVLNCIIRNNATTSADDESSYASQGGGIAIKSGKLVNSLVVGNSVNGSNNNQSVGGGVATTEKHADIINCTIVKNKVMGLGGGIGFQTSNAAGMTASVSNCIVWGNVARQDSYGEGQQNVRNSSVTTATVGIILCPDPVPFASEVISGDPMFTNAEGGDYTLSEGSPAIDKGDDPPVADFSFDLLGNPRVNGDAVDLGAYEYTSGSSAIDNVGINDEIVKTQYYDLSGCEIYRPGISGIYIMKNTYASKKVTTEKVYITVK